MECLFSDFRSKKHKKILVFSSLIRTFELQVLPLEKTQENLGFFLAYSYLCT